MTNKVKFTLTRLPIDRCVNNEGQIPEVPANPRTLGKKEFERLKKKLRELDFTAARPLIAYPQGGQYVVFCGNQRLRALREIGETEINAAIVPEDMSAEELRKILLADNVSDGEWDTDMLANEEFPAEEAEWAGVEEAIWNTEGVEKKEAQEDDFDEDKDKVETVCKKGDIWLLGQHRLMCGDSTDPNNFARLMDGNIADIAFTSPPYGVNDGSIRKHQEKGKSDHSAKNFYLEHDDNMGTWPSLVEETWQRMHENSKQQFINIQMLADNKRELLQWAARHADHFVDMLIWNKVNAAPQMQPNVVNNVYENIYVFGEKDATRKLEFGAFRGNQSAIIEVRVGNNEYSDIHKAVFPVALPAAIFNINSRAKSVLDCFGGTGTTMIAAEQLGRKCYMMEIDPHYCDIIIARWEKLTGQKACKL